MDEVAFVESLFAPEMRSAVAHPAAATMLPSPPSSGGVLPHGLLLPPPLGSLHALASPPASQTSCGRVAKSGATPSGVPPPPNSLLGGGIFSNALAQLYQGQSQGQSQPRASSDDSLYVRLQAGGDEDDVIGQLLVDQDFAADLHDKKEGEDVSPVSVAAKPPSSTNSLLMEPLDMPRSGGATMDQFFKDTFVGVSDSSSDSPMHTQQYRSSVTPGSSASPTGITRGGILSSSASPTYTGGFYSDSTMMPVFPLSSSPAHGGFYGHYNGNYPPVSPSPAQGWTQNGQNGDSTPGSFQRMHASQMSMKHMMMLASVNMSSPMGQQQLATATPGSMGAFSSPMTLVSQQQPTTPAPLWISASKLNPPEAPLTANASERKRATKTRSKSRLPVQSSGPASFTLSLSISPPASLTKCDSNVFKDLIASGDYEKLCMPSSNCEANQRVKRERTPKNEGSSGRKKAKMMLLSSPSRDENSGDAVNTKSTKPTKGKKCIEPNCTRRAQSNSRCKAHGGGARCQYSGPGGCTRSSQGGGFCRAHGGGKRCEFSGCQRGQQRKGRCYVHGGIRKCQWGTCEKKDRGNGFCISHGGGKRCEHPGCSRAVRRGVLCQLHE